MKWMQEGLYRLPRELPNKKLLCALTDTYEVRHLNSEAFMSSLYRTQEIDPIKGQCGRQCPEDGKEYFP